MTVATTITSIYVGLCLLLIVYLPLQHKNGRAYPFLFLTLLHMIYTSVTLSFPSWDGFSMLIGICGGWFVLGLFRGDQPHNATFSTIQWLGTFWLVFVARTVPHTLILWEIYILGVIYAIFQLREILIVKQKDGTSNVLFGNSNHNSAYYCLALVCGIYLMQTTSSYLAIPNILLMIVIWLSTARSGIIAMFVATPIMFGLLPTIISISILTSIILIVYKLGWYGRHKTAKSNIIWRWILIQMSIILIKRNPIFGNGIESFRRDCIELLFTLKSKKIQTFITDFLSHHSIGTNRVHNDFVELVVEVGFVGLILFLLPFFFIPITPFYLTLIVMMGTIALFFFPFREIHTSIPFYAILATTIPNNIPTPPTFIFQFILVFVCLFVGWEVYKKFIALLGYDKVMTGEDLKTIVDSINVALINSPNDTTYLTHATALSTPSDIITAYEFISRAINHYDGDTTLWELNHQMASTLLKTNSLDIAAEYLSKALTINPTYTPSRELLNSVNAVRLKHQFKEEYNESRV